MRFLAGVIVLAVLAAGCATVALPTDSEWHYRSGDACRGVGLIGILRGSEADPKVAWFEDRATGERAELIWPVGYRARFTPQLEVLDDHDQTVGRAGDLVIGTCFRREPGEPIHLSADGLQPAR